MAKQQFTVNGTTCKSCEVVIERELGKLPNILSAHVSHEKQIMDIETTDDHTYTSKELSRILKKHDYTVHDAGHKTTPAREAINWGRVGAVAIFILSLYIILDQIGLLRFSPSSAEPVGLIGVLVIGLIASLSSCTAVVGGLVAAVSGAVAKDQEGMSSWEKFRPHLYFNFGRIAGFFAFGALIGYLGSSIQLSPALNGAFVILVAALMVVIGINLLGVFPAPVLAMPKWLAHKVHDLAESKDPKAPALLGAMTFFLPCGFTQSMQLFALSLQDPLQSGLIMGVFALGTTPVLLGIGKATTSFTGDTLKKITQAAGAIVLILGISNFTNGLTLLGVNPSISFARTTQPINNEVFIENGRQQVFMEVQSRGSYNPATITVQEGIPVDWRITGADFMGCADTLILPAFGVNTTLRTGSNLVQFTPTKAGNYTFSCSMGMIRGTMIVTSLK